MAVTTKRSIDLSAEQAAFVDGLVASGAYSSPDEVVEAGLRALRNHDTVVERWLREEVVPVYDAMQADPSRGRSAEQVLEAIRARYAEHVRSGKRDV